MDGRRVEADSGRPRFPRRRILLLLAAAVPALLPGCRSKPKTGHQKAETDQEVVRNILKEYNADPRLSGIKVKCLKKVITLQGRVDHRKTVEKAVEIARSVAPEATVVSEVEIRPR